MEWIIFSVLAVLLLLILNYFVTAVGKMKCAEKMGSSYGWMSFLPFLSAWLTGKMAENSDEARKPGKRAKKWSAIGVTVKIVCALLETAFVSALLTLAGTFVSSQNRFLRNLLSFLFGKTEKEFLSGAAALTAAMIAVILATVVLMILSDLVDYLLLYKIYMSFDSKKGGLLFTLTFFLPPAEAVIYMIFGCSKKAAPAAAALPGGGDLPAPKTRGRRPVRASAGAEELPASPAERPEEKKDFWKELRASQDLEGTNGARKDL